MGKSKTILGMEVDRSHGREWGGTGRHGIGWKPIPQEPVEKDQVDKSRHPLAKNTRS